MRKQAIALEAALHARLRGDLACSSLTSLGKALRDASGVCDPTIDIATMPISRCLNGSVHDVERAIALIEAELALTPAPAAPAPAAEQPTPAPAADLLDEAKEGAQQAKASEAWSKLTETHRSYLIAALELGAVDEDHRSTTKKIAKNAGYKAGNANGRHAFQLLNGLGYIESKAGQRGGIWLTELGRQVAEFGNCGS